MPDLQIHLVHFVEIIAALIATPAVGFYVWRGLRKRQHERLTRGESRRPPSLR